MVCRSNLAAIAVLVEIDNAKNELEKA